MANITIVATGGTRASTQLALAERFRADGHAVRCIASGPALRFLASHMIRRPSKIAPFLRMFRTGRRELFAYFKERPKDVPHISEGRWADVFVMVPATCNSLGKLVSGISDNFPLLVLRAVPRGKKVIIVPSMNPEMWYDPAVQRNVDLLNSTEKYRVLCPSRGRMLSGDWGIGAQVPLGEIVAETYRALGLGERSIEELFATGGMRARRREPAGAGARRPPMNVVLVDEDRGLTGEIAAALGREYPCFRVHRFASASAALDWLAVHPASLVVTELRFSTGASGYDLIERCRRPGNPPVPIVATGAAERSAAGAERLGRLDVLYVPKPLNLPYIVGMIAGSAQGGTVERSRSAMKRRRLAAGRTLFREGERGTRVYVVESGRLRVVRRHGAGAVEVGSVEKGGMVGEMAFFGSAVRSATVEAVETSELVELDLDDLRDYLGRQPAWLRAMIESLIAHIGTTSERLAGATARCVPDDSGRSRRLAAAEGVGDVVAPPVARPFPAAALEPAASHL